MGSTVLQESRLPLDILATGVSLNGDIDGRMGALGKLSATDGRVVRYMGFAEFSEEVVAGPVALADVGTRFGLSNESELLDEGGGDKCDISSWGRLRRRSWCELLSFGWV